MRPVNVSYASKPESHNHKLRRFLPLLGRKAVPRCWRLCNPWWKRGHLRCLASVCPLNPKTTWFSIISASVMTRVTRVTGEIMDDHA